MIRSRLAINNYMPHLYLFVHEDSPGKGGIENKHSIDLAYPPLPPCMSIHPEGTSCGHVRSQFECLLPMILQSGYKAGVAEKGLAYAGTTFQGQLSICYILIPPGEAVQVDPTLTPG